MPVRLPFVPEPNPDEILGSWLARVALLNGGGAWRAFIEDLGYGPKVDHSFFDLPDYSSRFAALIAALGREYEPTMLKLSTLPYWLTFDAADLATSRMPGMTATPQLGSYRGILRSSIQSMGIARSSGEARRPRYCPKCLNVDAAEHGAAYWHRAHQLPNIFFCHLHKVRLRTACPSCGVSVAMTNQQLIRLPVLHCACGANLCASSDAEESSASYLMLAKLSFEALSVGQPHWNRDQVRTYLRAVMREGGGKRLRQYQGIIESAFGTWRSANKASYEPEAARRTQNEDFRLCYHFSMSHAPECCALMAAMNLEFADVIPGFIRASPHGTKGHKKAVTSGSWDVQRARSEILRGCAEQPGRPPSRHRRPYWFLRLNDPEWLLSTFPSVLVEAIPDLEADRVVICQLIANDAKSATRRRVIIRDSPAGLRALFRDEVWLRNQLTTLRSQGVQSACKQRTDVDLERLQALNSALEEILKSPQRPFRIFATTLGSAVGLSHSQTGEVIRKFPELKMAIESANEDKHRRQVLWAVNQLREHGQPLSLKAILRKASLPTYARNFEFARAALEALGADA